MHNPPAGTSRPTGTVTFLFTDIEGSTKRWEAYPQAMQAAFASQEAILRQAIDANGGYAYKMIGDAFQAAFPTAPQALRAALDAQHSLHSESWPTETGEVRVRMALHTGTTEERGDDYVGPALNRVARLLSAGHGGQVLLSEVTHGLVRDALPPGVEILDMGEHRLKDLIRPEHIFQLVVSGLPSEFPPLKTLDTRPNNLPLQPTPLVGREKELAELEEMLAREEVRLVTLTGPGGTGKTRLGLQAASEVLDDNAYPDGVWFVDLSPLVDSGLVVPTIAGVLGVKEAGGGTPIVDTLKEYLRDKRLLLVLDNFEQVTDAAREVSALIATCPHLNVLATSRVPLHIRGEKEYPVPPLSTPDMRHLPPPERLSQYEAVRLFIERATDVKPDFQVTNENAPAVAEICVRLDGLPLAIELAAARVKLLPLQALLVRLSSRLKLLTGGARDLPARQQTLRATIEWSYDLLSAEEQALFRRMAVFAGGCTLEAAEAVCNYDKKGIDVLESISSLLDKSLLRQADTGGEPRFFMLETLREYGLEQMEQNGEIEEVRKAHVEFYLPRSVDWLELAGGDFSVPDWRPYMDRLVPEMDNSRAASSWLLEHSTEGAVILCGFLAYFWHDRGYHSEARNLVEKALALPGASSKPGYAEGLLLAGSLAQTSGDMSAAAARFQSVIALLKEKRLAGQGAFAAYARPGMTYDSYLGWALGQLASAVASQDGPAAAFDVVVESVEELRASGKETALAMAEIGLGTAYAFRGELDKARSTLEEALAIGRKRDDRWIILVAGQMLGDVARIQGDFKAAAALYQQGISLSDNLGIKSEISARLHNLAYAELGQGNVERARELFMESVAAQHDAEHKGSIAEALAGFAALAAFEGRAERAMRLYGAVRAIWDSNHLAAWPAEQAEFERYTLRARAQVDEATGKRAWDEGYATSIQSLKQALDYALESTQQMQQPPGETGDTRH